jgi:hypothetical protein
MGKTLYQFYAGSKQQSEEENDKYDEELGDAFEER